MGEPMKNARSGKGTAEGAEERPNTINGSAQLPAVQDIDIFALPRFVPWRFRQNAKNPDKIDKVPTNGEYGLSTNRPEQWMNAETASAIAKAHQLPGIGIVMTGGVKSGDKRLVGLDFDAVDFDRFHSPFDSYAETSPSGKGVRMFLWVPEDWACRYRDTTDDRPDHCHHVELYLGSSPRFLTVTGRQLDGSPSTIADATAADLAWLEQYLKPAEAEGAPLALPGIAVGTPIDLTKIELTDDQRKLVSGELSQGQRSEAMFGLLTRLTDGGALVDDILATMTHEPGLWGYFASKRPSGGESGAAKFAKEEIARAYRASLTGMKEKAMGTTKKKGGGGGLDVPAAQFLTTDQANANRLHAAFGGDVLVLARQWYVYDGTHWSADRAAARRLTCTLSLLIQAEAAEWGNKVADSEEERQKNKDIAAALRKWAKQSEMKVKIDAAFGLLEDMVAVEADVLDADPYLLNCANGTVDLRSGKLRPHDKADRITKLIPIAYRPDATAPLFEKALAQITGEAGFVRKPLAEFLQRWFGYCATGLTDEQQFVVHNGNGANGKSLLLDTITRVLGPYAGVAAPNLLVSTAHAQDRHPTELADLRGKRLVVAHESGEDGVLREEFIKRATGSDRIKARRMRQDFVEFEPTHKLQLLTNHKPQIRGQDHAIWRRVLLVPYGVTFGTASDVEQGAAHFTKDEALGERLKSEAEGILTWIVKGAGKWRMLGLDAPDAVLMASAAYREEQDRVGQFLAEGCERKEGATVSLAELYRTYTSWTKQSGYAPLGKNKFAEAVGKRPGITVQGNAHYKDTFFGEDRRGTVFTGVKALRNFS